MVKYKIEFDRELCIGALACTAVAEKFWPRADDGKVDLSGAKYNEETKKWELIIDEKDYEINKDAAEVCPVDAIKIIKIEDQDTKQESIESKEKIQNPDENQENNEKQNTVENNSFSINKNN